MNTFVYIDTRGASKGMYRNAPKGARLAFHCDRGVVELEVNPDGTWHVNEGPPANKAGSYRHIITGQIGKNP